MAGTLRPFTGVRDLGLSEGFAHRANLVVASPRRYRGVPQGGGTKMC